MLHSPPSLPNETISRAWTLETEDLSVYSISERIFTVHCCCLREDLNCEFAFDYVSKRVHIHLEIGAWLQFECAGDINYPIVYDLTDYSSFSISPVTSLNVDISIKKLKHRRGGVETALNMTAEGSAQVLRSIKHGINNVLLIQDLIYAQMGEYAIHMIHFQPSGYLVALLTNKTSGELEAMISSTSSNIQLDKDETYSDAWLLDCQGRDIHGSPLGMHVVTIHEVLQVPSNRQTTGYKAKCNAVLWRGTDGNRRVLRGTAYLQSMG